MSYQVVYTDRARSNIRAHVKHLVGQHVSAETIERWYVPLFDAIDNLYDMPRLHPVDEPYSEQVGHEVRKYTYKKKYLVRYRIDDDTRTVYVLSFFHGSRRKEA